MCGSTARRGPSGIALVPALSSSWAPALSSTPQRRSEKVTGVMGASFLPDQYEARIAADLDHRQRLAQPVVIAQRNERIGGGRLLPGRGERGLVGHELPRLPLDRLVELVL